MARRVAIGIAVAAIAVAILVLPRLVPRTQRPDDEPPAHTRTQWAQEAGRLAAAWTTTYQRLRLEQYRATLEPRADSARRAGGTAPLLLIDGPSTPAQRRMLSDQLAEMWKRADPEGFKVAVALVFLRDSAASAPPPDAPLLSHAGAATYFFPDSAHRSLCIAVINATYAERRLFASPTPTATAETVTWLSQSLGPCAFYGAFGTPGRTVGRWLRGGGLQFALTPHWWMPKRGAGSPQWWLAAGGQTPSWWWDYFYGNFPFDGIACYAGRLPRCLTAVYDSTALADSAPTSWNTANWWKDQGLLGGTGYLSDVVATVGTDRFSRLWTTDLPFDSAFHLAVDTSLMEWTKNWAHRNGPEISVGGAPPPNTLPGGLIVSALALSLALLYARRRQIG
jgi:hypothetical protein